MNINTNFESIELMHKEVGRFQKSVNTALQQVNLIFAGQTTQDKIAQYNQTIAELNILATQFEDLIFTVSVRSLGPFSEEEMDKELILLQRFGDILSVYALYQKHRQALQDVAAFTQTSQSDILPLHNIIRLTTLRKRLDGYKQRWTDCFNEAICIAATIKPESPIDLIRHVEDLTQEISDTRQSIDQINQRFEKIKETHKPYASDAQEIIFNRMVNSMATVLKAISHSHKKRFLILVCNIQKEPHFVDSF